jgi:predicted metal-dependent HD superfamily phosphohydrolase
MDSAIYKMRRQNFLYTLLPPRRLHIYQTEFFRAKYEKQAVENIRREIERH